MPHCTVGTENSAAVEIYYAYFKAFLDNFCNVDKLAPERISERAWQASFNVAAASSPHATYTCVDAEPTRAGAVEDRAAA